MYFIENKSFHIHNQGNNKRPLFYSDENYSYFLWKMKTYLLPFGDFISWCLLPNQFHWQFLVRNITIPKADFKFHQMEILHKWRYEKHNSQAFNLTILKSKLQEQYKDQFVNLNDAIGTLQQSYTKAINKQLGWSGSLFRGKCKAKDRICHNLISGIELGRNTAYHFDTKENYESKCFQLIHDMPILTGLVKEHEDYMWSSAQDYKYNIQSSICNLKLGLELFHNPAKSLSHA